MEQLLKYDETKADFNAAVNQYSFIRERIATGKIELERAKKQWFKNAHKIDMIEKIIAMDIDLATCLKKYISMLNKRMQIFQSLEESNRQPGKTFY